MTDQQHRATPEQWALQERWGSHSCFFARAVLARWGSPAIEPVPQQEVE
jgi:hypothetical protein